MTRPVVIEHAIARAAERAGRPLPTWLVVHIAGEVTAELTANPPQPTAHAPLPDGMRLTARQRQIAAMFAQGLTNKEIGTRLYLTEDTVKTHARRTCHAIGARDRAHAAALAVRFGIATPIPQPRTTPEQ